MRTRTAGPPPGVPPELPGHLPRLLAPSALEALLGAPGLVVVDLSKREHRALASLPGATGIDYADLVAARPPAAGLLPEPSSVAAVLSAAGISPSSAVVAGDDEGCGKAGRLLWTLEALGHAGPLAMLDGGVPAWRAEGRPSPPCVASPTPAPGYPAAYVRPAVATREHILEALGDPGVCLLDTRSPAEFDGTDVRAARGGHIPGAVSYEWTRAMDATRERRLRPAEALRAELAEYGVTPDREIIVYCQTHHRSSHTYWTLRWLGFERVLGYPGAWSEWGNDPELPVES